MKLALVLLMSAVGFGQQAKPEEKCVEGPTRREVSCPKPHKPKPSVKTPSDLYSLCRKNAGTVAQCKAETAPQVICQGCGGGDNYPTFSDPRDGIACTGPLEMLKPDGCDVAADECWAVHKAAVPVGPQKKCWPSSDGVNETCDIGGGITTSTLVTVINKDALEGWPLNKAAAPVEPQNEYFQFTGVTPPSFTIMSQGDGCSWLGFQYDAKTKTCSMKITFDVSSQVVCTPLVLNEQGKPEMTCSFKPIDKGGK